MDGHTYKEIFTSRFGPKKESSEFEVKIQKFYQCKRRKREIRNIPRRIQGFQPRKQRKNCVEKILETLLSVHNIIKLGNASFRPRSPKNM